MGRKQSHKKDIRAEKAKVKLKQTKTKFLPKGQNVTDTAFKIKSIVLPQQLQEKDFGVPLSKRNLNAKDLLSHLKHYNENVRHGACEELSEMIKIHTHEIVQQHLAQVCLSVSSLMQDRTKKVRNGAVKVIHSTLEHVPEEKIQPFYNYFSTNLRCAMTNIDKNIQEDSLLFLDCFLKHGCNFISLSSEKLLPDFFTLISKLRNDSNIVRTLTVNLNSKLTSVTWRIKVLSRLHAILKMILLEETKIGEPITSKHFEFNPDASNTFPMYKENFSKSLENGFLNGSGDSQNVNVNSRCTEVLNRHIITLIPLLYETWLEVVPERKVDKSMTENTVLSEEAAAILCCIMNTLYLLWQYVNTFDNNDDISVESVFLSREGKQFLNHLVTNFPYCQTPTKLKQKLKLKNVNLKILESNEDLKCTRENILICFMCSVLHANHFQNTSKMETAAVFNYIRKCLLTKKNIDQNSITYLTEFLKECLGKNYQRWKRIGIDLNLILENAIIFYDNEKLNNKNKTDIFSILSGVIDNSYLSRSRKYQNWLQHLPGLLCQPKISDVTVDSLLQISKKNNNTFHSSLMQSLPKILDNLNNLCIKITENSSIQNTENVKRNIVNIFFYAPSFSRSDVTCFRNFLAENCNSEYSVYLSQLFELRKEFNKNDDML